MIPLVVCAMLALLVVCATIVHAVRIYVAPFTAPEPRRIQAVDMPEGSVLVIESDRVLSNTEMEHLRAAFAAAGAAIVLEPGTRVAAVLQPAGDIAGNGEADVAEPGNVKDWRITTCYAERDDPHERVCKTAGGVTIELSFDPKQAKPDLTHCGMT